MIQQSCRTEIAVRCLGRKNAPLKNAQAFFVCVRNLQNKIVLADHPDRNGTVRFPVEENLEYQVSVYAPAGFRPVAAHCWIRLPRECRRDLCFVFDRETVCCPVCRAIYLTDQNYFGLPISKGAIGLWRNPMK